MRIGFAGLGRMGYPMVENLVSAGYDVLAFDPGVTRVPQGATRLGAGADLAAADITLSMLPDGATTRALVSESLSGAGGHHLHVIMGTVGPTVVRELAADAAVQVIDAPVSGSVSMAQAASITTMVGSSAEQFERVQPVLRAITSQQFHAGDAGAGQAAKLAVNTVLAGLSEAVAEGLMVADAGQLDLGIFYTILESSAAGAPYVGYKRDSFLDPQSTPVAATIGLIRKDLGLALEVADRRHVRLPGAQAAYAILQEGVDTGLQEADMAEVITVLRATSAAHETAPNPL
jgi:3-hydroxyisobutyrate dehydrogenase-like beta-hydroxyacid dehydrogenase